MKEKVINSTRNIFQKEKDYHKPENLDKFYSESLMKSDENKTRSIEEHLDKIRPYLRDLIKDLKKI